MESTVVWVGYECPKCGHEGHEQVDATEMQGCALEVFEMTCSECGYEFTADEEYYEDENE
jgi:rubredoxin